MWDNESTFHREGMEIKYERITAKQKKAARAKPATYKAPESAKRLLSGTGGSARDKYKNSTSSGVSNLGTMRAIAKLPIDDNAPVQLVNVRQCFYTNTILKNVRSC